MREAFTATADSSLSRIFAISAFERLVLQSSISLATSVSDHLMEVVLDLVCAAALELVATIEGFPCEKWRRKCLGNITDRMLHLKRKTRCAMK